MIEDKDILQASATIIAGALILVSIILTTYAGKDTDEKAMKIVQRTAILGLGILFPAVAAVYFSLFSRLNLAKSALYVSVTSMLGFLMSYLIP